MSSAEQRAALAYDRCRIEEPTRELRRAIELLRGLLFHADVDAGEITHDDRCGVFLCHCGLKAKIDAAQRWLNEGEL